MRAIQIRVAFNTQILELGSDVLVSQLRQPPQLLVHDLDLLVDLFGDKGCLLFALALPLLERIHDLLGERSLVLGDNLLKILFLDRLAQLVELKGAAVANSQVVVEAQHV